MEATGLWRKPYVTFLVHLHLRLMRRMSLQHGYVTYPEELSAKIHSKLKRNLEQAEFVDTKLQDAFSAFEANEKDKGSKAILVIYNLDVKQFM